MRRIANRIRPYWKRIVMDGVVYQLAAKMNRGDYIVDEEWDHLIILDACRYDMFENEVANWDIDGKLESRVSRGANTPSFLMENFEDAEYEDIVYISANPYTNGIKENVYKEVSVWSFGWDDELNTVPPESVYNAAIKTIREHPDKRFIIHFMQPHHPFLKAKFTCRLKGTNAWTLLKKGKLNRGIVLRAYNENLRILKPYIEQLLNVLSGRVVVTSDHGNAMGERLHPLIPKKVYGHSYSWVRIKPLVKVPWFITEGKGDNKSIEKELVRLKTDNLKDKLEV